MPPPPWAPSLGCSHWADPAPAHIPSPRKGQPPPPGTALLSLAGLDKFEGWYLHSRDYKSPQAFAEKRVIVVGTGNSGIDIAVELSHTAKQVMSQDNQAQHAPAPCSQPVFIPGPRSSEFGPALHFVLNVPSHFYQVFLSTKRGTWVMHRVAEGGYPFDFSYLSRFTQLLQSLLPLSVSNFILERKLNMRFDHALYGLKPKHR